jgi:hypothetical protein
MVETLICPVRAITEPPTAQPSFGEVIETAASSAEGKTGPAGDH